MEKMKMENKRESNKNNKLKECNTEGNIDMNHLKIDRIILEGLLFDTF